MNLGTFILTPVLLAATAALGQVQPDASAPQRTGAPHAVSATTWNKLTTERFPGKQDDIFFINVRVSWYGNGASKVFRTTDGGDT